MTNRVEGLAQRAKREARVRVGLARVATQVVGPSRTKERKVEVQAVGQSQTSPTRAVVVRVVDPAQGHRVGVVTQAQEAVEAPVEAEEEVVAVAGKAED